MQPPGLAPGAKFLKQEVTIRGAPGEHTAVRAKIARTVSTHTLQGWFLRGQVPHPPRVVRVNHREETAIRTKPTNPGHSEAKSGQKHDFAIVHRVSDGEVARSILDGIFLQVRIKTELCVKVR